MDWPPPAMLMERADEAKNDGSHKNNQRYTDDGCHQPGVAMPMNFWKSATAEATTQSKSSASAPRIIRVSAYSTKTAIARKP